MRRKRVCKPEPGTIEGAMQRFNLKRETCLRYLKTGAPVSYAIEFCAWFGLKDNDTIVYGTRGRGPRKALERTSAERRTGRVTAHRLPDAVEAGTGAATPTLPRRNRPGQVPTLTVIEGGKRE